MTTSLIFLLSDEPLTNLEFDVPKEIRDQVRGGIKLISYEFFLKQQVTTDVSNRARTSGRPVLSDISCEKLLDQSSTLLTDRCLRAKTLGETCRLQVFNFRGDELINKMEYKLSKVIVSSYQVSSKNNEVPTELFKLNFTDIMQSYFEQNDKEPNQTSSGWSISTNRPV